MRIFYFLLCIILARALPVKADLLLDEELNRDYTIYYKVKGLAKFSKEFDFYYSAKPHGKGSKTNILVEGKQIPLTGIGSEGRVFYIWAVSKRTNLKTQNYSCIYDSRDLTLKLEAIKYNMLIFNWGTGKSYLNQTAPFANFPTNIRNGGLLLVSFTSFLLLLGFYFKNSRTSRFA